MGTNIIKQITIFVLLLLLSGTGAFAQQPLFKVYAVSGKVKVHKPGKKYRALNVSDELTGNETIKVANGAVLNLICSNYTAVQVSKAGTYKMESFSANCEKEQAGLFTKYFEYIWTELLNKSVKPEAAPLQSMKNKGAVSRGCPGIAFFYPIDTLKLVSHNWDLNWDASGKPVTVSVHDSEYEGATNYTSDRKGNKIASTDFVTALIEDEVNYLQVVPEGNANCPRYPILKLSEKAFAETMKQYTNGLPTTGTSAYYFTRSLIEEDQKFLGEALASLNKAIALEPSNKIYKDHLAYFKVKYNLR